MHSSSHIFSFSSEVHFPTTPWAFPSSSDFALYMDWWFLVASAFNLQSWSHEKVWLLLSCPSQATRAFLPGVNYGNLFPSTRNEKKPVLPFGSTQERMYVEESQEKKGKKNKPSFPPPPSPPFFVPNRNLQASCSQWVLNIQVSRRDVLFVIRAKE